MPDIESVPTFLLGCFADFYEEIAGIKLAIEQGNLPAYLTTGDEAPPTRGADLAARASARLELFLRQQEKNVQRNSSVTEIETYKHAQYAMTALADEIFILNLDWAGRDAWMGVLLERKLSSSHNAGTHFFEEVEQLLHSHRKDILDRDLASVFLFALQLGFKGNLRGGENAAELQSRRQQLYRLADARSPAESEQPAFPETYAHCRKGAKDERLGSLTPWYLAGGIALALYFIVSSIVWVAAMRPFYHESANKLKATPSSGVDRRQ